MAQITAQSGVTSDGSSPITEVTLGNDQNGGAAAGLLDLEKELTCSICTEILYQPLTLLNCLHTFCGGCLKEWFKWQGLSAVEKYARDRGYSSHTHISSPYTCPSCRSTVQDTRPNASITSLLDLWLAANPGKGRTHNERAEVDQHYMKGENVLPDVEALLRTTYNNERQDDPQTDRRLLGEVRELSLREMRQDRRRITEDSTAGGARRTRQNEPASRITNNVGDVTGDRRRPRQRQSRNRSEQSRQLVLEHQSSLRSLLGVNDIDSSDLEQEIMRQIMSEGLLEGLDLGNMDPGQEDELSERIAQAFRERRRARQQGRQSEIAGRTAENIQRTAPRERGDSRGARRRSESEVRAAPRERRQSSADSRRPRGDSNLEREQASSERQSRPPISRPRLLEAATGVGHTERRSSSQGQVDRARQENVSVFEERPGSAEAIRTTSDLGDRARSRERGSGSDARARLTSRERRATDSEVSGTRVSDAWRATGAAVSSPLANLRTAPVIDTSSRITTPRQTSLLSLSSESASSNSISLRTPSVITDISHAVRSAPLNQRASTTTSPPTTTSNSTHARPPSITCESCKAQHIESDLHYICHKCPGSASELSYALCLPCYRSGRGCKHWYGFGHGAMIRYERRAPSGGYPLSHELPHVMVAEQYIETEIHNDLSQNQSNSEPELMFQQGKFCDNCFKNANSCYWLCDICNDGEWGFCDGCVNTAHHCSHPLLPLKTTPAATNSPNRQSRPRNPSSPVTDQPKVLTIHTQCAHCLKHILYAQARFHCPTCNAGDYDICTPCYNGMVTTGHISIQNGPQGWRRCPQGHRMLVTGFDDPKPERRRVVLEGIVGGWALHEGDASAPGSSGTSPVSEAPDRTDGVKTPPGLQRWSWRDPDTGGNWKHKKRPSPRERRLSMETGNNAGTSTTKTYTNTNTTVNAVAALKDIPPSGGHGMKMVALWNRFPDRSIEDELAFPRGAVIEEVVDINGDWCWGVYCRRAGLFPGGWTKVSC